MILQNLSSVYQSTRCCNHARKLNHHYNLIQSINLFVVYLRSLLLIRNAQEKFACFFWITQTKVVVSNFEILSQNLYTGLNKTTINIRLEYEFRTLILQSWSAPQLLLYEEFGKCIKTSFYLLSSTNIWRKF